MHCSLHLSRKINYDFNNKILNLDFLIQTNFPSDANFAEFLRTFSFCKGLTTCNMCWLKYIPGSVLVVSSDVFGAPKPRNLRGTSQEV